MFGMGGQKITRLNHIPITQSVQAVALPIVLGQDRIEMFLLWYGNFKSKNAGGKKGGSGKGLGAKGQGYTYTASVQAALCQGPSSGIVSVWGSNGKFIQQTASENYTVPGGGGSYTSANAALFANDAGVGVQTSYSQAVNDYGSPGPTTLSGTYLVPLTAVSSSPGLNQYSINPSTGVYTFGAAMAGKTVTVSYTYYYYYYDTEETDIIPSTGPYQITVTNAANFKADLGVAYDPSGIALTKISSGTPASGQYKVSSGVYTFAAADANKAVTISYEWQNQTTEPNAPNTLGYTFFSGTLGQSVWPFLTSNFPGAALGYSQIAHVDFQTLYLGEAATVPPLTFEMMGRDQYGSGIVDCNPADCILDMLTSTDAGIGAGSPLTFPPAYVGSLSQARKCWSAYSFFISNAYKNQQDAQSVLAAWLEAGQVGAFWSEGVLKFVPYADTSAAGNGQIYVANTQPIVQLDDSDFIAGENEDPIKITEKEAPDRFNRVAIDWVVRSNSYNHDILYEEDLSDIQANGLRQEGPTTYEFIKTLAAAQYAASTRVKRLVYIYRQYAFNLSWIYSYLEPMDIVLIADPRLWGSYIPVRIISIEDDPKNGLAITAENFPWGTATASLFTKQTVTPSFPLQGGQDPGSINPPIIFEAPNRITGAAPGASAQAGYYLGFGICGANPANWGGCNVWMSEDGNTYKYAGTVYYPSRMGVLTANFPSGSDPDTVNTCSVDLSESSANLTSASTADADADRTLCLVDNELISYSTATLVAGSLYNLTTYIRRGQMTTAIAAHTTGAPFLRLDDSVFYWQYDATMIGKTLYFKFTSFNTLTQMEQELSQVTAYTITPSGNSIGLLTPAHSSYRPLTNPLTGHDAGSSATINVAAFTMRVPGQDISENSGSITGLAYNTLYYVYFDDPNFTGGTVSYQATTAKETALDVAARLFVGSIQTPLAGALDTTGNGDGGSGAQSGMMNVLSPSTVTSSLVGNGSASNILNAIDGNDTTFATLSATGNGSSNQAGLDFTIPPGIARRYQSMTIEIVYSVPTNSLNASPARTCASLAAFGPTGSALGGDLIAAGSGAITKRISTITIPLGTNVGAVSINPGINLNSSSTSGSITLQIYEVRIKAIE